MTHYVAAYDTESPECLAGIRQIVKMHESFELPATFFLVAGVVEQQRAEYKALLKNHPLFEIACHTYTHMPLIDTPRFGKAGQPERYPRELVESKRLLEDIFQVPVRGFRPPVSAPEGLRGKTDILGILTTSGYTYISSAAWDKEFSMPAPLRRPYTYADEGYPDLWELPPCGWHENLLKGHNLHEPLLLCLFPAPIPEAIPAHYVRTAQEEFMYNNKPFIDRAIRDQMPLISLVWHPWSMHRMDPSMQVLDITFRYVRDNGLPCTTFAELRATNILPV